MQGNDDKQQAQDFAAVFEYLKSVCVVPAPVPQKMEALARQIHNATYSLILWKFRLTKLPSCTSPFIDEIASDALQIMPQMLLGYSKTTRLLMRGLLENALRFVYFYDHPVEFYQMNVRDRWYLATDKLFDYIKTHPNHAVAKKKFDAISRAHTLYSTLSAGVHGRSMKDLESRSSLSKIMFNPTTTNKDLQLLKKCSEAVNFIIAIENRHQLAKFRLADRKIIFGSMAPAARAAWHSFEEVMRRE